MYFYSHVFSRHSVIFCSFYIPKKCVWCPYHLGRVPCHVKRRAEIMRQPWIIPPLTEENIHRVFLTRKNPRLHLIEKKRQVSVCFADFSLTMLASLISPMEMILNSTSTITGGPIRELWRIYPSYTNKYWISHFGVRYSQLSSHLLWVNHLSNDEKASLSLNPSLITESTREAWKQGAFVLALPHTSLTLGRKRFRIARLSQASDSISHDDHINI